VPWLDGATEERVSIGHPGLPSEGSPCPAQRQANGYVLQPGSSGECRLLSDAKDGVEGRRPGMARFLNRLDCDPIAVVGLGRGWA